LCPYCPIRIGKHVTIVVNQTSDWLPSDYEKGLLRGSEEMITLFARELSAQGYRVTVFSSCHGDTFMDGNIVYLDRAFVKDHERRGTLIAFKDQDALYLTDFNDRYLWTADPVILEPAQRRLCDGMFAISAWHKRELMGLNIGYDKIGFIEPGIEVSEPTGVKRVSKQCLYASSPDRGLEFLESIWPDVLDSHSDATLITTYSGVKSRTNKQMVRLYQQSDILAYPCMGQERYCITAIKAQIYGAIPVVIPHMVLTDTVQYGVKSLQSDYLSSIISLLNDGERRINIRQKMIKGVKYRSWAGVVYDWGKIIGQRYEKGHAKY